MIAGDYLVCGEGLHETRNARIICLSLKQGQQGRVLWTHRTATHVECSPVVWRDRVYIGAGDDGYYCIALEPDADGAADVKWHLPGKDYPDAETSLAIADGKLYVGMGTADYIHTAEELDELPGGEVWCFDLATMDVLWKTRTGRTVLGAVAVGQGRCYAAGRDGVLYQIRADDGQMLAKFNARASIMA